MTLHMEENENIQNNLKKLKLDFDMKFFGNDDIKLLENKILEHSKPYRRKVAMIIMLTMDDIEKTYKKWEKLPWIYYVFVIQRLIEKKKLTAYGDTNYPRYSEVSLFKP